MQFLFKPEETPKGRDGEEIGRENGRKGQKSRVESAAHRIRSICTDRMLRLHRKISSSSPVFHSTRLIIRIGSKPEKGDGLELIIKMICGDKSRNRSVEEDAEYR